MSESPANDAGARKKVRESEKIRARRPQRVTYDLPPALRGRIKALADAERIPASQVVTLALLRFLRAYDAGDHDLGAKQPSRSPRYDWNLEYAEDLLAAITPEKTEGRKRTS